MTYQDFSPSQYTCTPLPTAASPKEGSSLLAAWTPEVSFWASALGRTVLPASAGIASSAVAGGLMSETGRADDGVGPVAGVGRVDFAALDLPACPLPCYKHVIQAVKECYCQADVFSIFADGNAI